MKNGFLEPDVGTHPYDIKVYSVVVFPNGSELWQEGGETRKVIYHTGDVVYFDEEGRAEKIVDHLGKVW